MTKKGPKKKFAKKLLHKYRLVILNEDTFEERFAIKLTRLNVFVIAALSSILLIALTTVLIAFTPLREYIPGYSSSKLKKDAIVLNTQTDSLKQQLEINNLYLASIRKVLNGDVESEQLNRDSIIAAVKLESDQFKLEPNRQDSLLRVQVAKEDKYNFFETAINNSNFVLVTPANGPISEGYNVQEKHYAIDVVLEKDTPIKATADGTVIFAEWTAETGYVIIIEHNNDLISVYKHNANLTKTQGDIVKGGEVIALAGNTGQFSTGVHLHFELWSKGYPIDPTNFIDFQ
ncbi:MAG: peptidase M23 [Bacteroidetes bacterium MedPE-SWsnd-G2]|nr:MAG: peptidase M23 [Bacteroidetes bacterium MedPE-SWsnd-G2]